MYSPTANSYFSGAGGLDLGMITAGVNVVQSVDLDPEATSCMQANPQYFGHQILNKDIKEMTVLDQDSPDVMAFTYPCTKYSAIADIHGLRTGDELFLHAFRHVAIRRPPMYVLENVPGMKKFKVVMEAMTKLPDYYVNIFCPVETTNWLPQKRNRLILIGTRKPFHISHPEQAIIRPRIKDIIQDGVLVDVPKNVISRLKGKYRDKPIIVDPADCDALAPTCVAHYAKDQGTRVVKDASYKYGVRPFTIREYARLQGFPDDFGFEDKLSSFRLIGNAVPVAMGRWVGDQIMRYFNNLAA